MFGTYGTIFQQLPKCVHTVGLKTCIRNKLIPIAIGSATNKSWYYQKRSPQLQATEGLIIKRKKYILKPVVSGH